MDSHKSPFVHADISKNCLQLPRRDALKLIGDVCKLGEYIGSPAPWLYYMRFDGGHGHCLISVIIISGIMRAGFSVTPLQGFLSSNYQVQINHDKVPLIYQSVNYLSRRSIRLLRHMLTDYYTQHKGAARLLVGWLVGCCCC